MEATSVAAVPVAKKSPTDFLKQVIGKPVVVKLHSGVSYKGVLACLDGFMNIAMEQTEEYVDGQLKNKYGDCFIRGNNGKSFSFCLCLYPVLTTVSVVRMQCCTSVPRKPRSKHQPPLFIHQTHSNPPYCTIAPLPFSVC